MTGPAKRRYNVGAVKLPHADRDIAHAVLTEDDPRGFVDIVGADTDDDHDDEHPIGSDVTYSVMLTDAEAARFRAASNARYVEPDVMMEPFGPIPTAQTMAWMDAPSPLTAVWHGKNVPVAIMDQGTTAAVRSAMGFTLLGRQNFGQSVLGGGELHAKSGGGFHNHGCLVAPNGVPQGGRLYDLLVVNRDGTSPTSAATAALRWAAQQGCKIVNYSFGGPNGSSAWLDVFKYCRDRDVQVFCAAGNDNKPYLAYPACYSSSFSNVHSVIAFDERTGARASFSNYAAHATGAAPGVKVTSLSPAATEVQWSGTSAASPHAASICARVATGGTFTPKQAAAAMRSTLRPTGAPPAQQGGGAFSLQRALDYLNPVVVIPPVNEKSLRVTQGQYADVAVFLNGLADEVDRLGTGCLVRRTTQLTLASSTDLALSWESLDIDTVGGMWDPQNPSVINIRVDGMYTITGQMRFGQYNTTGSRVMRLLQNGTGIAQAVSSDKKPGSNDGEAVTLSTTVTLRLAKGEQIRMGVWQNSGAAALCADLDFGGTYLAINRVGQYY